MSHGRACLQELAAQGKLPPGRVMSFAKPGEDQIATVFRDVYINDAPPEMRHHMTKRPTQDDVARRTGTQVRLRLSNHANTRHARCRGAPVNTWPLWDCTGACLCVTQ